MNRRLFGFVLLLMGVSLAGIILLQLFWISNAIHLREEHFDRNVNLALRETVNKLESHENILLLNDRFTSFNRGSMRTDSTEDVFILSRDSAEIHNYNCTIDADGSSSVVISMWNGKDDNEVVEYKHEVRIDSLRQTVSRVKAMVGIDSLSKMITHDIVFVSNEGDTVIEGPENGYLIVKRAKDLEEAFIQMAYEIETEAVPIQERIDPGLIPEVMAVELFNRDIHSGFEFAVMKLDTAKSFPIKSTGFNTGEGKHKYMVSLFPNELVDESYFLVVVFPDRNMHVLRSMAWVLAASLLLTLVILATFGITIFMILRQKKLSDIKSDFINNMTHEFKTPIATISLAVDSIDNPRIIQEEKEVKYYTGIIREENRRMNTQVENVLRMSLLDKHDLEFNPAEVDIHELIRLAMGKVDLLLKERKGEIVFEPEAENSLFSIDPDHFTNAMLNLLDNAIKYTEKDPLIRISTRNERKGILISIADNGMGMNRDVQKRIFEKFYRQSSGNIHNIKGFGLGLSYVKAIVDAIGGSISVKSETGKGSTFEVFIPGK